MKVTFILLLFASVVFSQQKYENQKLGFKYIAPPGWKIDTISQNSISAEIKIFSISYDWFYQIYAEWNNSQTDAFDQVWKYPWKVLDSLVGIGKGTAKELTVNSTSSVIDLDMSLSYKWLGIPFNEYLSCSTQGSTSYKKQLVFYTTKAVDSTEVTKVLNGLTFSTTGVQPKVSATTKQHSKEYYDVLGRVHGNVELKAFTGSFINKK
jgi:hypothetical protein